MPTLGERLRKSWNAFIGRDPTDLAAPVTSAGASIIEYGSYYRPDRPRFTRGNERSIVSTIYNQIAVDVSAININHIRIDENGRFVEVIDDSLNQALTVSANIDQTGRELIKDIVMSMFDEGVVAVVPVETDVNPLRTDAYKIYELRTGRITQWYPEAVKISVYRQDRGKREEIILPKRIVAIIENPFYSIMNEPNSTLQRLIRILNQIDRTNEQNAAGKLDLIIQLPYVIKSKARRDQAESRRKDIEEQLTGSQYGIAYTDGTEKVVQLNRSLENNLWTQAKDLTAQLYNQLGLSESVFNGTADEATQLNYYNRTVEPILSAITENMDRKWISKTARTQNQAIGFYRDPFKLVPVSSIAEIADKFTRNEIMSKNEIRSVIGMKPSDDPKADMLINSNLNQSSEQEAQIQALRNGEDPEAMQEPKIQTREDIANAQEASKVSTGFNFGMINANRLISDVKLERGM